MTLLEMQRAITLITEALRLRAQFDTFVLLKRDSGTRGESISIGEPVSCKKGEYHRLDFPIPEDARRYVFRLWRKEVAQRYNALVRELNQLGAAHEFRLIEFSAQTGEPTV